MSIVLFIIILAVLILVHEIGHFVVAKKFGIRVDEFGIGYPPRAIGKKIGETIYSLNFIPFGGFVKIFGENANDADNPEDTGRNFSQKPRYVQALVLVAGVAFNAIFAWLLISVGFMVGLPTPASYSSAVSGSKLVITSVMKSSPAELAGIRIGDVIVSATTSKTALATVQTESFQNFIAGVKNAPVGLTLARGTEIIHTEITPKEGVVENRPAIGVSLEMIGTLRLNPISALWEGGKNTLVLIEQTTVGLGKFLFQSVTGRANFSEVSGPVGIVGMVGDISLLGFIYLLSFTATISINLAVINLIPFPALDGGRLLFVLIEKIKGSPIKPVVANALNSIGFFLLILLMGVVTYHDIAKLIH